MCKLVTIDFLPTKCLSGCAAAWPSLSELVGCRKSGARVLSAPINPAIPLSVSLKRTWRREAGVLWHWLHYVDVRQMSTVRADVEPDIEAIQRALFRTRV